MGGNVKVGEYQAEPFVVSKDNITIDKNLRIDLIEVMYSISRQFASFTGGQRLFDDHINMNCFTGSASHLLCEDISNYDIAVYKPRFGDIDIQTAYHYKSRFEDFLKTYPKLGYYTVKAWSKHGNEISVLMEKTGKIYQFDFQFVDDPGSNSERFLHSSDWEDIKLGIKGAHHKLLLNAVGLDDWKFSIINGLVSRIYGGTGIKNPNDICGRLFGQASLFDAHYINSFRGLCELVRKYTDPKYHDAIFEKFAKDSQDRIKDQESNNMAILHLATTLGATLSVG